MAPQTEIIVRLTLFAGVLIIMSVWELLSPCRHLSIRKAPRWASNLGLVVLNTIATRLIIPLTTVAAATLAATRGYGILHQVQWPEWLEIALAVLAFDLAIYIQHVMFHAIPVLWRVHQVHHADLDFDVSTGLRFHTIEILLSALFKLAVVFAIGPAPLAVVVFEVLLNGTSMFNHSNVQIPLWLDRKLRWFVVTPDMHRVHHSVLRHESNTNFGFNIPWWDVLWGTYQDQPSRGHEAMQIGLAAPRDELRVDRLPGMLMLPFSPVTASDLDTSAGSVSQ